MKIRPQKIQCFTKLSPSAALLQSSQNGSSEGSLRHKNYYLDYGLASKQ